MGSYNNLAQLGKCPIFSLKNHSTLLCILGGGGAHIQLLFGKKEGQKKQGPFFSLFPNQLTLRLYVHIPIICTKPWAQGMKVSLSLCINYFQHALATPPSPTPPPPPPPPPPPLHPQTDPSRRIRRPIGCVVGGGDD